MKNALTPEGMMMFMHKHVLLMCMNYFYYGYLEDVNGDLAIISKPRIVYQTGKWDAKTWQRAEELPAKTWSVRIATIESCGEIERK
jgi:hypothetical protein